MEAVLFVLFFTLVPILAFAWLIYAIKRKPKNQAAEPEPEVKQESDMLHGHDLNKWHYLGYVELKLDSTEYPTFLFANKNDLNKRSYKITNDTHGYCRKNHSYVTKYLDTWTKGEYELYTLVRCSPSRWLKEYMLATYKCEWDSKTNWWKSTDSAKYTAAQKKQTKTPPKEDAQKDPVVIQVEFGKKNED